MNTKYRNTFAHKLETSTKLALGGKHREALRKEQRRSIRTKTISAVQTNATNVYPVIYWSDGQADQAILNLCINGKHVEPDTSFKIRIVREFSDLLMGLFSQAQTIVVEPLSGGFSNTGVVKVQPFYTEGGTGRSVVVKFGDRHIIEEEYEHYRKYIQYFVGDGRCTTVLDYQTTSHLGGIIYSFVGTTPEHTRDFGSFYQQSDVSGIKGTLDLLFRSTCRLWYANHHPLQILNLTEDYQWQSSHVPELEQFVVDRLPQVVFQQELIFSSLDKIPTRPLPNPFHLLKTMPSLISSTYVSLTHGDFNQRNIFVDQAGYPWLIDFQSAGPSHILRDVVTLDAVIRLQLLLSTQATLDERLALEEALCEMTHFSQFEQFQANFRTTNPALAKVWETVVHLRKLAHWLVEKKPSDEMCEYYRALFYVTLNTLSFSSLEVEQREHALLSASLLADMLR